MKRYWYHIRQNNPFVNGCGEWGNTIRIYPKPHGYFRGPNEPEHPRFCVAPTIAQCVSALGYGCLIDAPIYVYRTAIQHDLSDSLVKAEGVVDSFITDEHWFVRPVTMKKYKIIHGHPYHNSPTAGASPEFGNNWAKLLIEQAKYLYHIQNDEALKCE